MSAVLKDFRKSNMSLYAIKKILVKMYDEKTAMTLLKDYCMESTTPEARHHGLELMLMNGYYQEFKTLLNINKQSHFEEDRVWAKLYELHYKSLQHKISHSDVLVELKKIPILTEEQRCLHTILKIYSNYEMRRYSVWAYLNEKLSEDLSQMQPSLLLEFYQLRSKEILFRYHWRKNELIIARKYGFTIINHKQISPARMSRVHIILALSYLFDGYDQSMYHLNEALKLAKKFELPAIEKLVKHHNLPFVSAYHGLTEGVETESLAEQAHLAVARGDREKAIEILSTFESLTPFQKYYLGLAKMDKQLLVQSYNSFVSEESHYFYARLPLQALNHMNMGGIR
ncbi:AimR family lysis-lysogeny pheromone receptor [Pontibacillus sp. HMF3514]|uniref:AimR family lysis-lysogeny pheromone receptor n=1 Tax=Pontibacillus sp. HMF3514 TaxID=2692425 RepID=UPI00131FC504|nr:AimR family lysis-lysogeny pheromone receptor [Pontibacillus sp. HMF3514]QHE53778.1 hypothetical protein GS400_17910 [Pontibacillus sp. HMF3514]